MKQQHPAHPYSVYRHRRNQAEIWEAQLLRQGRNFVRMLCTSGAIVPPWLFEVLERVAVRLGVWPVHVPDPLDQITKVYGQGDWANWVSAPKGQTDDWL